MGLLYQYIKLGYRKNLKEAIPIPIKVGIIQGRGRILPPILRNIHMYFFDHWVVSYLVFNFNKGGIRKKNREYFRKYYQNGFKVKNKNIELVFSTEWKRIYYFRYADDFIIGVDGSKKDCMVLKNIINKFLRTELNIVLNLEKTKITHAKKESAQFLGYRIHKTIMKKTSIKRNKLGCLRRIVTRPLLDAPVREVVKRLIGSKYATKIGNPTRNVRFINQRLINIINYYCAVERKILNYYSLANNYANIVARVHFILKYSCVSTIASKMKLKTKKKVFKKYGKDLKILNEKKDIKVCYSTVGYKSPVKISEALIEM